MSNKNFGKIENGGFCYADNYVIMENGAIIINPTSEQYVDAGYLPVVDNGPEHIEGKHAVSSVWVKENDAWVRHWEYQDDEPIVEPPKKYSKLKIYGAIAQLGKWDAVKSWLESKNINGINGWVAFELAQEISNQHPLFNSLFEEASQVLEMNMAELDDILNNCLLDD